MFQFLFAASGIEKGETKIEKVHLVEFLKLPPRSYSMAALVLGAKDDSPSPPRKRELSSGQLSAMPGGARNRQRGESFDTDDKEIQIKGGSSGVAEEATQGSADDAWDVGYEDQMPRESGLTPLVGALNVDHGKERTLSSMG